MTYQHRVAAVLLAMTVAAGLAACSSANPAVTAASVSPSVSSPAPVSVPASATPAVSSSPALVTLVGNLETTADSQPFDTQGIAEVNGVSYPNSLGAQFCFGSSERQWTFVLGRKYSSLQGTIGLSDDSVSAAKIRFEVLGDGQVLFSRDLQVGQSVTLDVPVTNVLQLGLDTTLLTQDGGCGAATGEWANVQVTGP